MSANRGRVVGRITVIRDEADVVVVPYDIVDEAHPGPTHISRLSTINTELTETEQAY